MQTQVQQIDPAVFNQQQAMVQAQAMQVAGPQLTLGGMDGFVNALVLAMIVGFTTGLGIWIALLLSK